MVSAVLTDTDRWRAVVARDRRVEGAFVYAVRSTRIYCRVGCPSRRPRRSQVEFYPVPAAAEQAGYRPCRRCRPLEALRDPHVALAEQVCRLLDATPEPLTLKELGRRCGVSPSHLQRVFSRVTGVSPRAYLEALRERRFRSELRNGSKVSRALYQAGYGSSSRVYERVDQTMGMTPTVYRKGGKGLRIGYATADSPLGRVLVAATDRGLCFVSLGRRDEELVGALSREFPEATRERADAMMWRYVEGAVSRLAGQVPDQALPLDIQATAFQRKVLEALRKIPRGTTVTYQELARRIGRPDAVRAVAGACASNKLAVVVPCHRVIRSDGGLGGYRWGKERKRRLLEVEGVGS